MADNVNNVNNETNEKKGLLTRAVEWFEKHPRIRKGFKIAGFITGATVVGLGGLAGADMIAGRKDYITLENRKRMADSPVVVDTTATIEETNEAEG